MEEHAIFSSLHPTCDFGHMKNVLGMSRLEPLESTALFARVRELPGHRRPFLGWSAELEKHCPSSRPEDMDRANRNQYPTLTLYDSRFAVAAVVRTRGRDNPKTQASKDLGWPADERNIHIWKDC